MPEPHRSQYERDKLSNLLRSLRVEAGLSTTGAARQAGFSQSKLSKIENGELLLNFSDAQALCRVYAVAEQQRDEVLDLVKGLHEEVESARVILGRGAYRKQWQIGQVEKETAAYRDLQVAMVSGLLQTPDYMRLVMGASMGAQDAEAAVQARIGRQAILRDRHRSFTFVMTEGALRWQAGSAALMADQVDHIIAVSTAKNVTVGVVPWTLAAPPGVFPTHEVHIYDERLVIVGIKTATATIADPRDIAAYLKLFEQVSLLARFGEQGRAELVRISGDYRSIA